MAKNFSYHVHKDSPHLTIESLYGDLKYYFRNEDDFTIEYEKIPFSVSSSLALRWNDWLVRISYEEGDAVREDSIEIERRLNSIATRDISKSDRRIRMVFSDDHDQSHTNCFIYLMDFLNEIKGVHIYDVQHNDIIFCDESK